MEEFSSLALIAGVAAVIVPTVAAFINMSRLVRATGDHLVLRVDNQKFVIDVGSLDRADIAVINSAAQAVERKAKLTA